MRSGSGAAGQRFRRRSRWKGQTRVETGPLSTWHWHALKAMGLPVICIDARHAKAALSMQINKTDRNDAAGLAQIMRTGWYREVGVKSLDNHQIRAVLGARAQLVGMQTDLKNQIKGSAEGLRHCPATGPQPVL